MDSALDEIDFLQDFEAKLSGTWQDLYYENDQDEQVSWFVKVLKDKKIRFVFLGLNWSTNQTFEAESPMLLKIVAKDKIKAYEDLEKKAIPAQCLKITQNVAFAFWLFHQFLSN